VADRGLLLSEAPLGAKPERWRFPARNRLLAGLADITVVVESHAKGGALLTAEEAAERGRPVMAVPGSVTSPASMGSNQLLADGCAPACAPSDVLDLLHFALPSPPRSPPISPTPASPEVPPSPLGRQVLTELAAGATHVDVLVAVSGRPVAEVLAELHHLQMAGLVQIDGSTVYRP
jgi:DNA processing protein